MRIIGHIVRKDFHRLRWVLVLWVLLMVAANAMAAIQARLDAETYYPFHLAAGIFGLALAPLAGFGLVMGFIHDDPVAEPNAFWITRPISPGELLAAKSIGLLVICIIPVLVTWPWWIGIGFGRGEFVRAAIQTGGFQAILTLVALPLAVISPNASRFVLHVIVAAACLLLMFVAYSSVSVSPGAVLDGERLRLIGLLGIPASVAVVLQQFFRRRTAHSIAILGLALACFWIMDPSGSGMGVGESAAPLAEKRELRSPLEVGKRVIGHGRSLVIQEKELETWNWPLTLSLRVTAPAKATTPSSFYLAGQNGDSLQAHVRVWGQQEIGAVNRSHVTLTFGSIHEAKNGPPASFPAWVANAELVTVVQNPESIP